jgi:hypothetical protein
LFLLLCGLFCLCLLGLGLAFPFALVIFLDFDSPAERGVCDFDGEIGLGSVLLVDEALKRHFCGVDVLLNAVHRDLELDEAADEQGELPDWVLDDVEEDQAGKGCREVKPVSCAYVR